MSLLTPSLGAAADVLDLAAELAGALTIATERLVIPLLDDGHVGVVSDEHPGDAVAPVAAGEDSVAADR